MKYKIFEPKTFYKSLLKLSDEEQKRVLLKLSTYIYPIISKQPHFGPNIKKLKGEYSPFLRYRFGDYRLTYSIDESRQTVILLSVSDRKDAYR